MWAAGLRGVSKGSSVKGSTVHGVCLIGTDLRLVTGVGGLAERIQSSAVYSTTDSVGCSGDKNSGKLTLAQSLAFLVEESSNVNTRRPRSRMELKRSLEVQIKKRVKEQYTNGKFRNLLIKVIATPQTLEDAYNCLRLNSNVDLALDRDEVSFESIAEDISEGKFDVSSRTFSISTKGVKKCKETLVLPKLELKVVQEAIRIVLEVVYRPYFSRISHGCRSGRGHSSALKYICKEISNPDWWFTLVSHKKLDASILNKLISTMEEKIEDPELYAILKKMLDARAINLEFGGFPKGHGLPQEGVLSPILINIYLDLFDREIYKMSMKYEALNPGFDKDHEETRSKLRGWFRRQLNVKYIKHDGTDKSGIRVHCCRFMDEIFFAISGSKGIAGEFLSEVKSYFRNVLFLDVDDQIEILPCDEQNGIRYLGALVRRSLQETPAIRAVHKLKEKVNLFAHQKQEVWDAGTVRIGKKWLAHGLKKVKESEIKHLADSYSLLSQISSFRKVGMETDHWYKLLLKIWLQDKKAEALESVEVVLSKHIVEPALPRALRDSFYEFQKQANAYVSSESASTSALLSQSLSSARSLPTTRIIAPVDSIKRRLSRYSLTNNEGYARACPFLVLQDKSQIIDWFFGITLRWLRWYRECDNFDQIKLLISDQVRKSCIRTLATKYRVHETEIEKKFDDELSIIPSTQEMEQEMSNGSMDSQGGGGGGDEALMYGISYSGLCLLSLARMVTPSRPCRCFVIGCLVAAPRVYSLHAMERQRFPGWKTGFSSCIHPSLNGRRVGLCNQHLKDLYLGRISLQSVDFSAWK